MLAALLRRRWPIPVLILVVVGAVAVGALATTGGGETALVIYNGRAHYGSEDIFLRFEEETGIDVELRGGTAVNIFGKRLSRAVHRQAITVVLLAIALVVASTMFLMLITDFGQERILFEVVSAFATVGLSTGITAGMPPAGQVVLILLMFIGRLGPVTLGTALALRSRPILYEYPKERPLIG